MGNDVWHPTDRLSEAPLGFWSVDVDTMTSRLDASMSTLFGLPPAEGAVGVACERMLRRIHPADRDAASSKVLAAIEGGGAPLSYSYRLLSPQGVYEEMRALGCCFRDDAGRPTHVAGILMRAAQAPAVPVEVQVIETLMNLRELSELTGDGVLPRLIDAVLLHAGRELARRIDPPPGR